MNPILLLDVSNLAHRAMHTTGELTHGGDGTGVVFGVLRDAISLTELHDTNRIAFCFDGGYDRRLEIYPEYKSNRRRKKNMDETELEARRGLRRQLYRLRTKHLPDAGFRNVFWQEGYEADDIIASICDDLCVDDDLVVVTTDQDLYQVLSSRVTIWNSIRKKPVTQESFEREFGIAPSMWASVKAIAGCDSDGVLGVKGVGEKTAAKFLAGNLKESTKAFRVIIGATKLIERNLLLVRLPMKGCGSFRLREDEVDGRRWDRVVESMGMKSLVGRMKR